MSTFLAYAQWWAAPIVLLGVSGTYFALGSPGQPLSRRLIASSHGAVGLLLYLVAFALMWHDPQGYRPQLAGTYAFLFLVPIAFIVVALLIFDGPRWVHILQVPNVLALLWAYFVGGMAITGDWL